MYLVCVPFDGSYELTGAHAPQLYGLIIAGGCDSFPVRTEGDRVDCGPVSLEAAYQPPDSQVPQLNRIVSGGRNEHHAIRAEGDGVYDIGMSVLNEQFRTGRGLRSGRSRQAATDDEYG